MDLTTKKCVPCEKGAKPLSAEDVKVFLFNLDRGWQTDGKKITKDYRFKDFKGAIIFANKVGEIAESEGHHPDIHIEKWNHVRIELYTHSIGGLHENDFIVAAKIEKLEKDY